MADAVHAADQGVVTDAEAQRSAIVEEMKQSLRGTPNPARPEAPYIGTPKNRAVYDFQVAALNQLIGNTTDPEKLKALQDGIKQLQTLKGKPPKATVRAPTERVLNRAKLARDLKNLDQSMADMEMFGLTPDMVRMEMHRDDLETGLGQKHPVKAHVMHAWVGGETKKKIIERISAAQRGVKAHGASLLSTLERRTAELRESTRVRVVNETEALLHIHMNRAGGRGALIGAGIGLTAAGITLLAHHLVAAAERKGKLSKATKATEQGMATNMAETYRQWMDRLLGNSDKPINIGDDLIAALGPGIFESYADGATQPPTEQPDGSDPRYRIDTDFDLINPAVRRHMATYALDRIAEISTQQRDTIRKTLMDQSVLQGIGPLEVARTIKQSIGLTAYQTNVVNSFRRKLENLDSSVFEMKLRDKRYDKTIERAIREDKALTPEQINPMVDAYHRRMLALRAQTIARTESIRATSYGAVARAQDVLDTHPNLDVIKHWIDTDDERTREAHVELGGQEVQGIETPFQSILGPIRWPCDEQATADNVINCRCSCGFKFIPRGTMIRSALVAS
jgi:hypothetical protein